MGLKRSSIPKSLRLHRVAALNAANAGYTTIGWDAELFDPSGLHDPVTNNSRITIPGSCKAKVSATIRLSASTVGSYRAIQIWKNGGTWADFWREPPGAGTPIISLTINDIIPCVAGDYIEIAVYQDSGGALPLNVGQTQCFCSISFEAA